MASESRLSKKEKAGLVREAFRKEGSLQVGQSWYVLSAKWFQRWKTAVNYDGESRVEDNNNDDEIQIDNAVLLQENTLLRDLQEGEHYELVPESVWKLLQQWYGGGPEIVRTVIEEGETNKRRRVEVYPLVLRVNKADGSENSTTSPLLEIELSKNASIRQLRNAIAEKLNIDKAKTKSRIWNLANEDNVEATNNAKIIDEQSNDKTLDELNITYGQKILFEIQSQDGTWPHQKKKCLDKEEDPSKNRNSVTNYYSASKNERTNLPGVCGLGNLGNTCFMNSALQCLSNTQPLTEYFLKEDYLNEINRVNPLGTKGKLVQEYGSLLKEMWSGKNSGVAPTSFKQSIARFAPQFSGFQQHDSQELLAYLLDGLHEDLNRIKEKPYVELKEADGRPDAEVAEEAWNLHLKRNHSIIVELFQGQYKSTVTCPETKCGKVSVTFDPFMFLSVPLPTENQHIQEVILYQGPNVPIRYNLMLKKSDRVLQLKQAICNIAQLQDPERLYIADIFGNKFYAQLPDSKPVSDIRASDRIWAFEAPEGDKLRMLKLMSGSTPKHEPFLLFLPPETTKRELYKQTYLCVKRFIKTDEDDMVDEFPFTLVVSNMHARPGGGDISPTDELMEASYKYILIQYSDVAINEDEIKKVIEHESVQLNDQGQITLQHCLQLFFTEELLEEQNPWYCPKCKEFRQAYKKFDLWKTPKVLVVHLKRFQYTRLWREKLNSLVHFPLTNLDLSSYFVPNSPQLTSSELPIYDLFAVSNHSGGLGGGHYTAYAKNFRDGKWYNFNDTWTSPVDSANIVTASAYLLLYIRRES